MNVAFLIYDRPDLTQRVFAEIRKARPERLFVVADGPKNEADREKCESARAIAVKIDWYCEVLTNFSETNLGCKKRVSSGLDWVFSKVEEVVILEDDCLPDGTFFRFCTELLDRYRNDMRVGHISGTNLGQRAPRGTYSYYFSRYSRIWGWATWRRAWQQYDVGMKLWPEIEASGRHYDMFSSREEAEHFRRFWNAVCREKVDTWDVQWLFCRLVHGSLSVTPNVNLVSNIGFGSGASRTSDRGDPFSGIPVQRMRFPLRHPPFMIYDNTADRLCAEAEFLARRGVLCNFWRSLRNTYFCRKYLRKGCS